jgi:hypothetical protein
MRRRPLFWLLVLGCCCVLTVNDVMAQANGRLYRFRNSTLPAESFGVPAWRNGIHVRLDAPTGARPRSLPIDDDKLMAMCAKETGCWVTLGLIGWSERGHTIKTLTSNGSCRLFIRVVDGLRHWAVDRWCTLWLATWPSDSKDNPAWNAEKPGFFAPYFSNTYGVDGRDSVVHPADDRGHVLVMANACSLAESPPDPASRDGSLLPDTATGFYLIAATPAWMGTDRYPAAGWPVTQAGRACELIIED